MKFSSCKSVAKSVSGRAFLSFLMIASAAVGDSSFRRHAAGGPVDAGLILIGSGNGNGNGNVGNFNGNGNSGNGNGNGNFGDFNGNGNSGDNNGNNNIGSGHGNGRKTSNNGDNQYDIDDNQLKLRQAICRQMGLCRAFP